MRLCAVPVLLCVGLGGGILASSASAAVVSQVVFRCDLPVTAPDLYCPQQLSLQFVSTPGSYLRRVGDEAVVAPASDQDSAGVQLVVGQYLLRPGGDYQSLLFGSVFLSQGDSYLASVGGWVGFVPAAIAEQQPNLVSWIPEVPAGQPATTDPSGKPAVAFRLEGTDQYLAMVNGALGLSAPGSAEAVPSDRAFQETMPLRPAAFPLIRSIS